MNFDNKESGTISKQQTGEKQKIVIARVDIEQQARDMAEEKMLSSKAEMGGFFGGFKKIWKHNLAQEYYRQKELAKARREIADSGNLYAGENGSQADHDIAMGAIVERFAADYEGEDLLRSGEDKKIMKNDNPEDVRFKNEVKSLIKRYASGGLTEEQFNLEKNNLYGKSEADKNSPAVYADNLLEVAKQIKNNISHNKGLAALDADFEIVRGNARTGVEGEAQYNAVDKMIEKIKGSSIGRIASMFVNETTMASAVAIAYGIGVKGSMSAIQRTAKWVGPLGMGLSAAVGGAVGGFRENKRLKEDRAQHSREMAKGGKKIEDESVQREKMEKYRYETKDASVLTGNLSNALSGLKKQQNDAQLFLVLDYLNEIESRIKFAEQEKVDLISFSDSKKVEQERKDMYVAVAEAKVFLKKNVHKDWAFCYGKSEQGLQQYLDNIKNTKIKNDFLTEKTVKDEAFNKMKRKEVAWAVAKGTAIGLVVGLAAQEATAYLDGTGMGFLGAGADGHAGAGGPQTVTSLEYFRRYVAGELPPGGGHGAGTLVGSKEFVAGHDDMFNHIKRGWADNNTPKFDRNELKLWWGGHHGSGIDDQGNYVFNIKHMQSEGSFHGSKHWDAQELMKSGKMKMLLSLSRDTQNHVIEVPIDTNGNAIIDPNSEIGKMAFQNVNGHAKFLGKFAEVAVAGEPVNGVEKVSILATHVGKGLHEILVAPDKVDYDLPYIIPIIPHNPLEQLKEEEKKKGQALGEGQSLGEGQQLAGGQQLPENQQMQGKQKMPWETGQEMVQVGPEITGKIILDRDKLLQSWADIMRRKEQTRAAASHTLYKLEKSPDLKYSDLNGETEEQRNQRFNEITRKLWDELTVHGLIKRDKTTGETELIKKSDHDGEACLKILELAGFVVNADTVKYIYPGETAKSGLVMDTSNSHGVVAQENGKRLVVDHHTPETYNNTSSTKFLYETLVELGLLERNAELDKFADFITEIDNGAPSGIEDKRVFDNYAQNMFGLYKKLPVEEVYTLIKGGQDPAMPLSEEYLKTHTHTNPKDGKEQPLFEYAKHVKSAIGKARIEINKMKKEGSVFDSGDDRFGKILIDVKTKDKNGNLKLRVSSEAGGSMLARSMGYGGYLIWSPEEDNFVLFTDKRMDEKSIPGGLGQGFNVRGGMWLKKSKAEDGEPLTVSLIEIFSKLAGDDFSPEDIRRANEEAAAAVENAKEKKKVYSEKNLTELAIDYLSYKGVKAPWIEKSIKKLEAGGKLGVNNEKYAKALLESFRKFKKETVETTADNIYKRLGRLIEDLGYFENNNAFTNNKTWAFWDLAKQYHMSKHPEDSGQEYKARNPFKSEAMKTEIVDRQFGWELYNHRSELLADKKFQKEFLKDPRTGPEIKQLLESPVDLAHKTHKTLSSFKLSLLGKWVREIVQDRKPASAAGTTPGTPPSQTASSAGTPAASANKPASSVNKPPVTPPSQPPAPGTPPLMPPNQPTATAEAKERQKIERSLGKKIAELKKLDPPHSKKFGDDLEYVLNNPSGKMFEFHPQTKLSIVNGIINLYRNHNNSMFDSINSFKGNNSNERFEVTSPGINLKTEVGEFDLNGFFYILDGTFEIAIKKGQANVIDKTGTPAKQNKPTTKTPSASSQPASPAAKPAAPANLPTAPGAMPPNQPVAEPPKSQKQFETELKAKYPEAYTNLTRQLKEQKIPRQAQLNFMEIVSKANLPEPRMEKLKNVKCLFGVIQRAFSDEVIDIVASGSGKLAVSFGKDIENNQASLDRLVGRFKMAERDLGTAQVPAAPGTPPAVSPNQPQLQGEYQKLSFAAKKKLSNAFMNFELSYDMLKNRAQKSDMNLLEFAVGFIRENDELRSKYETSLNLIPADKRDADSIEKLAVGIILEKEHSIAEELLKEKDAEIGKKDREMSAAKGASTKRSLEKEKQKLESEREKIEIRSGLLWVDLMDLPPNQPVVEPPKSKMQFEADVKSQYPEVFANLSRQLNDQKIPRQAQLNFMEIVSKANLPEPRMEKLKNVEYHFWMGGGKFPEEISTIRASISGKLEVVFGNDSKNDSSSIEKQTKRLRIAERMI